MQTRWGGKQIRQANLQTKKQRGKLHRRIHLHVYGIMHVVHVQARAKPKNKETANEGNQTMQNNDKRAACRRTDVHVYEITHMLCMCEHAQQQQKQREQANNAITYTTKQHV